MHVPRLAVAGVLLAALGCGGGKPAVNQAPFRKAIEAYLETGSMDMRPDEFVSLEVDGDTATAVVKMAAKGELGYGLKPKWTIQFRRKDGKWEMTSYKAG